MSTVPPLRPVTVPDFRAARARGAKLAVVTAYDYTSARLCDEAGVDCILVGDSLGMVVQGHPTSLPVTLDEMIYHTRCVVRGVRRALVVVDMPFLTYQVSPQQAVRNAGRLLKEAGAHAVKLEGGVRMQASGEGLRRCRHSGDGARRADAAGRPSARRLQGAARRRGTPGGRRRGGGGRRVLAGGGERPGGPRGEDHGRGDDPDHRHRRGCGLRWPGAGLPRHARPVPGLQAEVREALRRPRHRSEGRGGEHIASEVREGSFPAAEHAFR